MRYLIDQDIRGSLAIRGNSASTNSRVRIFQNPDLVPADWSPSLRVLSLDIETDPGAQRILSIGLFGCGAAEVILVTPQGSDLPKSAVPVVSEEELLRQLTRRIGDLEPDVLTGWNVADFDFAVLLRRAEELGVARKLTGPPGRLISYCMTVVGPEPLAELRSPIDYQHYLDKQLRPVADPVLG